MKEEGGGGRKGRMRRGREKEEEVQNGEREGEQEKDKEKWRRRMWRPATLMPQCGVPCTACMDLLPFFLISQGSPLRSLGGKFTPTFAFLS